MVPGNELRGSTRTFSYAKAQKGKKGPRTPADSLSRYLENKLPPYNLNYSVTGCSLLSLPYATTL